MGLSDFGASIVQTLLDVFEPIDDALESPETFARLMMRMGWEPPAETQFLQAVTQFLGTRPLLQAARDLVTEQQVSGGMSDDEVRALITKGVAIIDSLRNLVGRPPPSGLAFPLNQQVFWDTFLTDLLQELFVAFLEEAHPSWFAVLYLLGIIDDVPVSADPAIGRLEHVKRVLIWSRLSTVVSSPTQLAADVYGWGGDLQADKLLGRVSTAMHAFGLPARLRFPGHAAVGAYFNPGPDLDSLRQLEVPIFRDRIGEGAYGEVALVAFPIPTTGSHTGPVRGLFIGPLLRGAAGTELPIGGAFVLRLRGGIEAEGGFGVELRPGKVGARLGAPVPSFDVAAELAFAPPEPVALLRSGTPPNVLLADLSVGIEVSGTSADPELRLVLRTSKLELQISPGGEDGLLARIFGASPFNVDLAGAIGWSSKHGLIVEGAGGLAITRTVNITIGPVEITQIQLAVNSGSGAEVTLGVTGSVALGPVVVAAQNVGAVITMEPAAAGESGTFGDLDVGFGFKFPTGIGVAIDAGSVSGGGFISFDKPNGRYFGALELNVYDISVKAFGLIETKFPDGHKGFSFIIVISAEFTPIQLGFGFSLNGIGGLIGINRTIDQDGLLAAIRKGELENILFPHDVVSRAPAIVQNLQTIFPASPDHYVFGPMAKLAWLGLVTGELGIIIEFPGPRLAIIGTVRAALPTPEEALVDLHFDVGGILDFPKKSFSLDASLTKESRVGDFPISGDMSMRLTWGDNPNFALSVGGFNKHFSPPAKFPKLNPVTIDLGVQGNPSINLSGYMALTSNTAQIGASLEARISQSGAELYGFVTFDALFVFSPFSFVATLDGAVGVNFHGYGFSLHLHGQVSGPSPWLISGSVCVSIWFYDACVGFTLPPLGNASKASVPGLDPWLGTTPRPDGTQEVPGLKQSFENARNWGGGKPTGSLSVVSLVAPLDASDPAPVDPLGTATVRQKACPLELTITKFAGTKPLTVRTFSVQTVTIGQGTMPVGAPIIKPPPVSDLFAPGQYQQMKDADLLSSPSFTSMPAGFTISSDAVTLGTPSPVGLLYDTVVFHPDGTVSETKEQFNPTQLHVSRTTKLSSAALGGIRTAGSSRFFDPTAPRKLTSGLEGYVLTSVGTLGSNGTFPLSSPVARPIATTALIALFAADPTALQKIQVTPFFNARP